MYTYVKDGDARFLTEWRLCISCGRMFNCNVHPHIIGQTKGLTLFAHLVCPPQKAEPLQLGRK